jgi:hypothetical protein
MAQLNGNGLHILADLELTMMGSNPTTQTALKTATNILQRLLQAMEQYAQASVNPNGPSNDDEYKRFIRFPYRYSLSQPIQDWKRLRATSTVFVCIPWLIDKYLIVQKKFLWFVKMPKEGEPHFANLYNIENNAANFQDGLPINKGAGRFIQKYGFAPVIQPLFKQSLKWSFTRLTGIINLMEYAVYDDGRCSYNKQKYWRQYIQHWIKLIERIHTLWQQSLKE